MKKTKKLFATVLSLAMATTMLSACSSGNTESNQSSKEPTATVSPTTNVKPTESAPTDEAGKDATQQPGTTAIETEEMTTVEETSASEAIIPLFKSEYTVDDIKKISPEELQTFDNFCKYFPVEILYQKDDGFAICKVAYDDHFKLFALDEKLYDVDYLVYGKPGGALTGVFDTTFELSPEYVDWRYEYYDSSKGYGFIPLFYDKERAVLVGYMHKDVHRAVMGVVNEDYDFGSHWDTSTYNNTDYYLVEVYYNCMSDSKYYFVSYQPAYASRYGM